MGLTSLSVCTYNGVKSNADSMALPAHKPQSDFERATDYTVVSVVSFFAYPSSACADFLTICIVSEWFANELLLTPTAAMWLHYQSLPLLPRNTFCIVISTSETPCRVLLCVCVCLAGDRIELQLQL